MLPGPCLQARRIRPGRTSAHRFAVPAPGRRTSLSSRARHEAITIHLTRLGGALPQSRSRSGGDVRPDRPSMMSTPSASTGLQRRIGYARLCRLWRSGCRAARSARSAGLWLGSGSQFSPWPKWPRERSTTVCPMSSHEGFGGHRTKPPEDTPNAEPEVASPWPAGPVRWRHDRAADQRPGPRRAV